MERRLICLFCVRGAKELRWRYKGGVAHNTQLCYRKIRFERQPESQVRTQSKTWRKVVATSTLKGSLDTVTTTKRWGGRNFTLT